jgi:hypothetical protein
MAEPKVDTWVDDDPANSAASLGNPPRVIVDDGIRPAFMLPGSEGGTPLGDPVHFDRA